ncbi:TRAP transporter small permease [Sulfitobacter sp. MF3-043]|uniref:TRAP transporter small permease n=1 Tax=Sulfitobacter sediminivivens TaxID=3252902 RepID=UPI0036DDD590
MRSLKLLGRHFEEVISCTCIAIIAICVFAQVVARYVFGIALHWSEEVASMAMVWAVYMGAAFCVKERFHIRILVGVKSLPMGLGRWVIFVSDFLWAFFCVFMIKVGVDYLAVAWKFSSTSPSLGINQFYPQSILVIGYALMLIRLILLYVDWYKDGRDGLPGMLDEEWGDTTQDQEHMI